MPGLEDLYREIILDHYRTPRNRGELESPPAVESNGHNPLCGDEITVYLLVEPYAVDFVRHRTRQVARELASLLPMLEPDPETHEAYRFYVDAYAETYPALRPLVHRMSEHIAGQETVEA